MAAADPNAVADLVLRRFGELPAKRKPAVRDNGLHEWVPLSGIVAERDGVLTCLSLATGMKCLPAAKLPQAKGNALHDWHAEVLAIRAFNRHLLDECRQLLSGESSLVRRREQHEISPDAPQPFAIQDGVALHMYCSEAPCGDASMELTMAAQEDASPWDMPAPEEAAAPSTETTTLPGRAYFSRLGVVRRKPARGDAPPAMSKSCSDKIALKQCTSLLSSLTSLLIYPGNAYLSSIFLPETQYSATGCERAFSAQGRMASLDGRIWRGGYRFAPFEVRTTEREFAFSKREVKARAEKIAASNLAAAWTAGGLDEGTMGGVLQGRKAFDARGASAVSRRRMWEEVAAIAGELGDDGEGLRRVLAGVTYAHVKGSELLAARREVKMEARREALAGWIANVGDDDFELPKR
ncbi:tRNA-specific adenosine deaminase 1 [Colletotrichum gloeosporioides]|uniref:tRNA-specific adenosine deaminase 1 n=1 Tax=Colletotrichum gloeosporioides TaxID=474922 RepID=A0A8H4CED0_COLGL|nr:tRNA-specific adenosine deaminase 1 [Colletotrichum gloeosporioides]KAF3802137.1 tRNA-specific adenosine deaminase 1 [Colletotrichum gloeosporioides]